MQRFENLRQVHLHAGAAHLDITPPLGVPMEGYWYARRATGILDPLFVRALVLATDDAIAAMVTADLCMLPGDWIDESAQHIQNASQISRDHLLVAASHTHTGPITGRLMSSDESVPGYREFVVHRIADVVKLARQRLTPARVGVGEGRAEGLAFNRRLLGADGRVVTNKPGECAEGAMPAGPVDHAVRVLYVVPQMSLQEPLAALVNFGLHPDTTSGTLISADYPGVLASTLNQMLGGAPEILFLNAPCGDINHLDPQHPRESYSREYAIRIGRMLAAEAFEATRRLRWLESPVLRAGREAVSLHVRAPDAEQIENARQVVKTHAGEPTKPLARARALLDVAVRAGETFTTTVSAIALNDVAFIGLPGEVFAATGMQIRAASPFTFNFIAELANDYVGYVPTRQAFAQGGYETQAGRGSFVEESAGDQLADAALHLLTRLR